MCYDISQQLTAALKRAKRQQDDEQARIIQEKMRKYGMPLFHASGFSHPTLLIYTNEGHRFATWGLIPFWVKNEDQAQSLWNRTLNARGETIFEKPSFRNAAKRGRCIIPVNGFFEHHHHAESGLKIPHFVYLPDNEIIHLAGLYEEWANPETGEIITTCSIVTTQANELMTFIHNGGKEPRMPVILTEEDEVSWLTGDKTLAKEAIKPYANELVTRTVAPLRGKKALGNVEQALAEYDYA